MTVTRTKPKAKVNVKGKPNPVVGLSKEALAAEDTLAVRLSQLAYADPKLSAKPQPGRKSKFWFQVEDNTLTVTKEAMRPRKLDHIDSQVDKRLKSYKKSSPKEFQNCIVAVREFFLNEIAPKTIAATGGTTQATEVIRRLLDTDVDPSTVDRFYTMLNRATTLKLAEFVVSYFGLPKEYMASIIGGKAQEQPPQGLDQLGLMMEMMTTKLAKANEGYLRKLERRMNESSQSPGS